MKEPITFRVVSIDPGANLGVAVSECDMDGTLIKVLHSETINLNKYAEIYHSGLVETYGLRFARVFALKTALLRILNKWQPDAVAHENAFMMMTRVTAGITLAEYVLFIKVAVDEYDSNTPIYGFAPFEIKSAVKAKKLNGDKNYISKALPLLEDLDLNGIDVNQLDEHSNDTIAIAYCFFTKVVKVGK